MRGNPSLSARQREELARLRDMAMPSSFRRDGWPGFPERCLDMRVVPTLVKLGYAEGGIHRFGSGRETGGGAWYRITEAGRAALGACPEVPDDRPSRT